MGDEEVRKPQVGGTRSRTVAFVRGLRTIVRCASQPFLPKLSLPCAVLTLVPRTLCLRPHILPRLLLPSPSTSVKLKSKQRRSSRLRGGRLPPVTVKNGRRHGPRLPGAAHGRPKIIKVIEHCKYHHKAEQESLPEDEKNVWDKDFVKVDDETFFNLILAANYLDIKSLLDLTCKNVADQIRGKTPEQIRTHFNIKNDFTPEEEEEVKRENAWCEER